jgi:exodeoxyribonuclease VII large subunit
VNQFSLFPSEPRIFSVSELNQFIRHVIESEFRLQDIWVTGELSNLSLPPSGHIYFTLKDESAALRCVMWRSEVANLLKTPQEGEAIEVHGKISVYEAGGQYQLYADQIRVSGEGVLYQEFARLRLKLEEEGLFDVERKRTLPPFPKRIGIVTSPKAAAFEDVLNVLRRRFPLVDIILSPTPVQGEEAPSGIVSALRALNEVSKPEVILVVRGGGPMEDLWAFNHEEVVRAVANSPIPIVTGIGHETDLILADFAADVRAPTPSAAAEISTPNRFELEGEVKEARSQLISLISEQITAHKWSLRNEQDRLRRTSPIAQINNARQQVDELQHRIRRATVHLLNVRKGAVEGLTRTLRVVGPEAVLERGFALVHRTEDGTLVRSVDQVEAGDELRVQVQDGTFDVDVREDSGDS